MAYDINSCRFSGKVQDIKQLNTKTGNPMTSFRLQCWRENIRCVGWGEIAGQMLSFRDGDRVEIAGKIQSSNWSKDDGTKVYSYQVIVDEIKADTGSQDQGKERTKPKCRIPTNKPEPPQQQNRNEYDFQGGPF